MHCDRLPPPPHHQPDDHSVGLFLNSEFIDFYLFEVSEGVECHEEKRVPPASDDEDDVSYSSTIYEQYKKERRRVNGHFHSHFQVILHSDRFRPQARRDFTQQSFFLYTFFNEYFSDDFIVHLEKWSLCV